jgi:UDP-N-acetylmuramoyl-tripeptide--D-alanyl-D-alanine ligase
MVGKAGDIPVFDVPDTLAGLQSLAIVWRRQVAPKVVGITGSSGKTATKELVSAILSRVYRVHATSGNYNNHIGVPLTILGMDESCQILVVEIGANHKKEIKHLCTVAEPDVGVITNIGPAHIGNFGSLKGVASAKAELIESLSEDGVSILPADDEFAGFLAGRTRARIVTFGFSEDSDVRISDVQDRDGGGYTFTVDGTEMEIRRFGRHNLLNTAAAAAVARMLDVPAGEAAAAIAEAPAVEGRGVVYNVDGLIFVDESYNSNPASLKAAVEAFMEMPSVGKRWLVLGDMLELGEKSAELHEEMGVFCGRTGVDGILTIGEETVELNRAAAQQNKAPEDISHFMDPANLAAHLDPFLREGDMILVKGSRGMRMETVIDEIERIRGVDRRRIG